MDQTVQAWGRLDILINNAGVARLGPFVDGSVADWKHMVGPRHVAVSEMLVRPTEQER